MDQFSVSLLGDFAVYDGDRRIDLPPACQRLVALVALKRRPVHRLWVCATLWPNTHTRRAVARQRSTLWRLRPAGADPLVVVDPQYLRLAPDVFVDWHHATDLIEDFGDYDGDADEALMSDLLPLLGAGDLLEGWVDRWITTERDRYQAMRRSALEMIDRCAAEPSPS
jgi:DNA-binding SARP family transcriptional activator